MGFTLYPHQKTQLKTLRKELKEHKHIIFGAPTGWGKSVAIDDIVREEYMSGNVTLVLAPTIKLVNQLYETLKVYKPIVFRGNDKRGHEQSNPKVIIAGLDTMNSRMTSDINFFGDVSKIVWDEVHISGNFNEATIKKSRVALLYKRYWDECTWIGLSATPMTEKWKKLVGWDRTIYETQTQELIDEGYLANYIYKGTGDELVSADNKKVKNGRYDMALASVDLTKPANLTRLIETADKYEASQHKTLIFCATIEHAEELHKRLVGSSVVHSGKGVNATKVIEDFQRSKSGILINVDILTTGFDDPSVDLLILARPIRTIRLAIQVWGRALRKYPNKTATIVDLCGVFADCGSPSQERDYTEEGNKTVGDPIYRYCNECEGVDLSGKWRYIRKLNKGKFVIEQTCPMCGHVVSQDVKDVELPADVTLVDSRKLKKKQDKAEKLRLKAEKKARKAEKKLKKSLKETKDFSQQQIINELKKIIKNHEYILGWKEGKAYYIVRDLINFGEREFLQKQAKLYVLDVMTDIQLVTTLNNRLKKVARNG